MSFAGTSEDPYELRAIYDATRNRDIPVALYGADKTGKPLAIISHGYHGKNTAYSFIADALVGQGYVVASIQHELPEDPPLAMGGDLLETRRPNWQSGAQDIMHVMTELVSDGIAAPEKGAVLIGHSNGGDIAMLFATWHPEQTRVAFSLDHRRMPVPRTASPRICSVRSSDYIADPGVFPDTDEQQRLQMLTKKVDGLKHAQMWDGATEEQKGVMLSVLKACLDY